MKKAACLLLLIEDKDAYLETFNILVVERLNESKIGYKMFLTNLSIIALKSLA